MKTRLRKFSFAPSTHSKVTTKL